MDLLPDSSGNPQTPSISAGNDSPVRSEFHSLSSNPSNVTIYYTAQTHVSPSTGSNCNSIPMTGSVPVELVNSNETTLNQSIEGQSSDLGPVNSQRLQRVIMSKILEPISEMSERNEKISFPKTIQNLDVDEEDMVRLYTKEKPEEEEDQEEKISFDELVHRPPYIPSSPVYSEFGKPSLRQSVISRQSTRLFPPADRVREHMEEQLVRWGAPQSAFKVDDILNGKHAYQKVDMPIYQLQTCEHSSLTGNSDQQTSIDNSTTDSNVGSILRSPYVTMKPIDEEVPKRMATFKESILDNVDNIEEPCLRQFETSPTKTETSIQNSAYFNAEEYPEDIIYEPCSASINSKYLPRTTDGSPKLEQLEPTVVINNNPDQQKIVPVTTPQADPLTEQDIPNLFKISAESSVETVQIDPQVNATIIRNGQRVLQEQEYDDDDIDCWTLTTDALNEMWNDFYSVVTCSEQQVIRRDTCE